MTLSKQREKLVDLTVNSWITVLDDDSEVIDDIPALKNHLTQALNDYTESIVRMVEGMRCNANDSSSPQEDAYDQALNDIKEELNK